MVLSRLCQGKKRSELKVENSVALTVQSIKSKPKRHLISKAELSFYHAEHLVVHHLFSDKRKASDDHFN